MQEFIKMFTGEDNIFAKYNIDRYKVSLILVLAAELIVYLNYILKLDLYKNSTFYPWMYVFFGIVLVATKIKPSLALGINLMVIFLPFIYFPTFTAFFFLFLVIIYLSTEKRSNSEYNFFNASIILTIYALNSFETNPLLLVVPLSVFFVIFGRRKGITGMYVLMIALIIMMLFSYPSKEMTLISRINNAPLYTMTVKKETIKGFTALQAYYSDPKENPKRNIDRVVMDAKTQKFKSENIMALIYSGSIAAMLSLFLDAFYNDKKTRTRYLIMISSFYTLTIMYILPYFLKTSMKLEVTNKVFEKSHIFVYILIYILSAFIFVLKTDEVLKPKVTIPRPVVNPNITSANIEQINDDLIEERNVIKEDIKESVKNELLDEISNSNYSYIDEINQLGHICIDLQSILTSLCQETLKCVGIEMYGDNWFVKVKEILDDNPDIFNYPTSILDYRKMDITMVTRLLTDCHFEIGLFVVKSTPLARYLRNARDARNHFDHNSFEERLHRMHAYELIKSINQLNEQLYRRFPNTFDAKVSGYYHHKAEEYIDSLENLR